MTIPQKLVEKTIKDYAATKSAHKTAKRVGLGSTTVYRILRSHGIECDGLAIHRQRIRKLPVKEVLLSEYASGMSEKALAEKYKCGPASVHEALHKHGAKMRPRGNLERVITAQEAKEIAQQYAELHSQTAVAALRGIHQSRVSVALRMAGVSAGRNSGDAHPSWKGGRCNAPGGYIQVWIPRDDPLAVMAQNNGYVLEHRLVMARSLGRPLLPHETVHHIDGDRKNNKPSNLQLRFGKHGSGVAMVCAKCGSNDISFTELHEGNLMVTVKLLKDVAEGGAEWTPDGPRNAAGQRPPIKTMRVKNPDYVPGGEAPEYIPMELRKDCVITMHEASAEKWASRSLCEVI